MVINILIRCLPRQILKVCGSSNAFAYFYERELWPSITCPLHSRYLHTLKDRVDSESEQLYVKRLNDPDTFGTIKPDLAADCEEVEAKEGEYLDTVNVIPLRRHERYYLKLILQYIKEKKLQDAIDVLETKMLTEDRVKPQYYIYAILIGECGRLGNFKKAFHLYNQMKKRGLKVTASTYTALFNSCANSLYPKTALEKASHLRQLMLEKGIEPNRLNYSAMIKAFGRCGDIASAFKIVDEMISKNIKLKEETFNNLLHACISDHAAGFRHAILIWRKLFQIGIKPDKFTYNLMLRAVRDCEIGNVDDANEVLLKITGENSKSGPCSTVKQIENSSLNLQPLSTVEVEDNNDKALLVAPDNSYCLENRPNLLAERPALGNIITLNEINKPEDRLLLLGGYSGFLSNMSEMNVEPTIKTFTLLLDCIPSTLSAEKVLIKAMKRYNIEPDTEFFNMMIKKRSFRFDYTGAKDVLDLLAEAKLMPDLVTFGVLSLACQNEVEARELLDNMDAAGYRVNIEILGAMVRNASAKFNFPYVMEIMNVVKEYKINVNQHFLDHLKDFDFRCKSMKNNKESLILHKTKMKRKAFVLNYKTFIDFYNKWLDTPVVKKHLK